LCTKNRNSGSLDPRTLSSLSSLGVSLHNFGQVDEAETKYRKILAKRLSLNESIHPDIAMSYNNLSSLLLNIGRINGYKVRTASEFMSLNIYLQKIILI